jgi:flagellar transcriptional activator FlhC
VAHKHDLQNNVVCGACQPPSRAGKTKKAAAAKLETQAQVDSQPQVVPHAVPHVLPNAVPQVAEPAVAELREAVEAIDEAIAQAAIDELEPETALAAA